MDTPSQFFSDWADFVLLPDDEFDHVAASFSSENTLEQEDGGAGVGIQETNFNEQTLLPVPHSSTRNKTPEQAIEDENDSSSHQHHHGENKTTTATTDATTTIPPPPRRRLGRPRKPLPPEQYYHYYYHHHKPNAAAAAAAASSSSSSSPPPFSRRLENLAKNRIAAQKCRQKRRARELDLSAHLAGLETTGSLLRSEHSDLVREATDLRETLMAHGRCNDPDIDSWLREEARRFVSREKWRVANSDGGEAGMGWDEGQRRPRR